MKTWTVSSKTGRIMGTVKAHTRKSARHAAKHKWGFYVGDVVEGEMPTGVQDVSEETLARESVLGDYAPPLATLGALVGSK